MRTKCYYNRIYGASDDLLEIDGALIEDEVNKIEGPFLVKCSDGTIANFIYDDEGQWKCEVKNKGTQFLELVAAFVNRWRGFRLIVNIIGHNNKKQVL